MAAQSEVGKYFHRSIYGDPWLWEGFFEVDGKRRTLWHNNSNFTPTEKPTIFFEDESSDWSGLRHAHEMPEHNYNNVLDVLGIPKPHQENEYVMVAGQQYYVQNLGHAVRVERSNPSIVPEPQQHTRIRRQRLRLSESTSLKPVKKYSTLTKRLAGAGLIYRGDFSHWHGAAQLTGAKNQLITRFNHPPR